MRELQTLRGYVTEVAANEGLRGSAGTHPFSLFERQRITAKDRYYALIDQLQYVARRELIFGMHPRRGRRPRQGDPGGQRAAAPARASARAVGELAVLARRANGARVEQADRVLRVFPRPPTAALP